MVRNGEKGLSFAVTAFSLTLKCFIHILTSHLPIFLFMEHNKTLSICVPSTLKNQVAFFFFHNQEKKQFVIIICSYINFITYIPVNAAKSGVPQLYLPNQRQTSTIAIM